MGANIHRRDILKLAGVTLTSSLTAAPVRAQTKRPKKVIIAGAGIAGLCCSYELMKRGHEIIVLEASGRPGGHVRTIHDPLPDGLYADTGAEHFYKPGYDVYWRYLEEFNLPVVAYPRRDHMMRIIGGKVYSEEDLQSRHILGQLGFNQREVDFLKIRPWWDLPLLYLQQYVDEIHDERQPFGVGLDHLDQITVTELFKKAGASDAAIRFGGGHGPALQEVWQSSIKKLRGAPRLSRKLFRIRGGNQRMTDAFASRLGKSVLLGCPVTGMRQGDTGVTVQYLDSGRERSIDADYLVSCMSLVMLSRIPVKPDWPEDKKYIIRNMPYYTVARVIFQSRSAFWKEDQISPNWETEDPDLRSLWSMAEEVNTPRAILIGDAESTTSEEKTIAAFRRIYPGKSENIEQALVVNWAIDPWALACERTSYKPGDLAKFWPKVIEPYGRIHFAGAYAAHMPWGQEAAVESANRVAEAIDKA